MGDGSGLGSWRDCGTAPETWVWGKRLNSAGSVLTLSVPGVWAFGLGTSRGTQGGSVGHKLLALGVRLREGVRVGREDGWAGGTVNKALGGQDRGMKGARWKQDGVSCPSSQRRRAFEPEEGSSLPGNSRKTRWLEDHPPNLAASSHCDLTSVAVMWREVSLSGLRRN